jgi:hypothetical protein
VPPWDGLHPVSLPATGRGRSEVQIDGAAVEPPACRIGIGAEIGLPGTAVWLFIASEKLTAS